MPEELWDWWLTPLREEEENWATGTMMSGSILLYIAVLYCKLQVFCSVRLVWEEKANIFNTF